MNSFNIVKGKEIGKKPKLYMKKVGMESITFHEFKKRVWKWGRRYGPYGVVRQEAGIATFYKVCKTPVLIQVIEEFDDNISPDLIEYTNK